RVEVGGADLVGLVVDLHRVVVLRLVLRGAVGADDAHLGALFLQPIVRHPELELLVVVLGEHGDPLSFQAHPVLLMMKRRSCAASAVWAAHPCRARANASRGAGARGLCSWGTNGSARFR